MSGDEALLDVKLKQLTTKEEGEQGLESKHFTFKEMIDRLNEQISQIDQNSKDNDQQFKQLEETCMFKVVGNKKKLQISASTFGSRNEYQIITLSDITQIKKQEKERQSNRF